MACELTNTTLDEIAERFTALDDFVICGHVNPDGDCLGSQLALMHALRHLGKKATCLLAKPDPIDVNLAFLPGIDEMVVGSEYDGTPQVFVAVDVPTVERIGTAAAVQEKCAVTFTIDHHATDVAMSQFNYVDPDSPSASMLVWQIAQKMGAVTADVAQCALTGLITDTGRFAYQNTTPFAFTCAAEMMEAGAQPAVINREFFQNRSLPSMQLERIVLDHMRLECNGAFAYSHLSADDFASNGAIKADAEPLIDTLRNIRGVRVALILRENADGEVRGSLRAKDESSDVAQVARVFGGGGHKAAAGLTYKGSLNQGLIDVPNAVKSLVFGLSEEGALHG